MKSFSRKSMMWKTPATETYKTLPHNTFTKKSICVEKKSCNDSIGNVLQVPLEN